MPPWATVGRKTHVPTLRKGRESLSCSVSASQITLSSAGQVCRPVARGVTATEEGTGGWGPTARQQNPGRLLLEGPQGAGREEGSLPLQDLG